MEKDPGKAKAPIDWAKWLAAASSVVRAIVSVIRSLDAGLGPSQEELDSYSCRAPRHINPPAADLFDLLTPVCPQRFRSTGHRSMSPVAQWIRFVRQVQTKPANL